MNYFRKSDKGKISFAAQLWHQFGCNRLICPVIETIEHFLLALSEAILQHIFQLIKR